MAFKVTLNEANIGRLLTSPAVQADLLRRARKIAAAAGPGMEPSVQVGRTRARGSVITATRKAREAEARDRALTRALDAGRS
jgi:hypothetical protein